MQTTIIFQSCLKEKDVYHPLGGSIDVGLLGENHHKINLFACEDHLSIKGVVPFLWIISFTTSLGR